MKKDFDFNVDSPRPRITNEMIIKSLSIFAKRNNCNYFSCRDYEEWSGKKVGVSTILKRFGNWNIALKHAGVKSLGKQRNNDPKILIKHLENCWKDLGVRPSSKQLEEYSKRVSVAISRKPYRRIWGSVLEACKRIEAFHNGFITEAELYRVISKVKTREVIPRGLRYDVLKRDNNTCVKCGANPKKHRNVRLEVDHIKPIAKGGTTQIDNLQTLCRECNQGKRDKRN